MRGIEERTLADGTTRFRAVVTTPTGKLTRTFDTATDAEEWAAPLRARRARGAQLTGAGNGLTLAKIWDQWKATQLQAATMAKNESLWNARVEPTWGHVPIRRITSFGLDGWVAGLVRDEQLAPASIQACLYLVSALLKSARARGLVEGNPVAAMTVRIEVPDSEFRVLTDAELERIFAAAEKLPPPRVAAWTPDRPLVPRPLLEFMSVTGVRWAEAAGLPVKGVVTDPAMLGVWIRQVLRRDGSIKPFPKNRKARYVPIDQRIADLLAPLLEGKSGTDLVFTTTGGSPLDYHNVRRRIWEPAVAAAKIAEPIPTLHDLRHTMATRNARFLTAHELREVLGHKDMRSLEKYLHSGSEAHDRMRAAMTRNVGQAD